MKSESRLIPKAQNLQAIVLDSDGVLADPLSQHNAAIQLTLDEFGFIDLAKEDYSNALKGASARQIFKALISAKSLKHSDFKSDEELAISMYDRKTEIYINTIKKDIDSGKLRARAGIDELLYEAEMREIPLGVASASNAEAVAALINRLGYSSYLAHNINPQGTHHKPDPRSYLRALQGCMVNHPMLFGKCVAIEDTAVGAQSALVAGMTVVITQSSFSRMDELEPLVKYGISPDEVKRLRQGKMFDDHIDVLSKIEAGRPRKIALILRSLDAFPDLKNREGQPLSIVDILDDMCDYNSRAS